MARAPLVTVPDEGAAWIVCDALTARGVTVQVAPAGPDHPYAANALARPMRVWVPADELERARSLLAALEEEIANDQRDLAAQTAAAGEAPAEVAAPPRSGRWFLYYLSLVVVVIMGGICYLADPRELDRLELDVAPQTWSFFSGWATGWAALALILSHTFGRRRVWRTVVLDVVALVLAGLLSLLLIPHP